MASCVLEPQFFLFQAVKQVLVGVGAMLFLVDLRVERSMLGCECLDRGLIHRCKFLSLLRRDSDCVINHEMRGFVSPDHPPGRLCECGSSRRIGWFPNAPEWINCRGMNDDETTPAN